MGAPDKVRLFVALEIRAEVLDALHRVQDTLRAAIGGDEVRWVARGKLHLTLSFLGHVPTAAAITLEKRLPLLAAGLPCFELAAAHLGCFPGCRAPKVLWVVVAGDLDALHELQRQVTLETADLAAQPEERAFRPHLTLGRVAPAPPARLRAIGEALGALNRDLPELGRWSVSEVLLMQSQLHPEGA